MKLITSILMSGALALNLYANEPKQQGNFVVNDIVKLEMPGKLVKSGKLELSPQQRVIMATQVRPIMHEQYNPMMQEAFLLERRIQRGLLQGRDAHDMKEWIDELTQMKRDALDLKVTALSNFISMLDDAQKKEYIKLTRGR